jgi:hypothetical protein
MEKHKLSVHGKKVYVRTATLNEIRQMADIPFSTLPYMAGDCGVNRRLNP